MAVWTTAFINDLPDSSFLYIEPTGTKDEDGRTVPRTLRHFPYKDMDGVVDLPHLRNALARIPQSGLSAEIKARLTTKAQNILQNQRSLLLDEFVRAGHYEMEIKRAGEQEALGTFMTGRLAVFDQWAEINSRMEGHFLERIAPGAFAKTIQEGAERVRVLFEHGFDPSIGMKPLGRVLTLDEDVDGVRYEVELLDADYVQDLVPGLEAGLYGSSFRFRPIKVEEVRWPRRSDYNPKRLPERTVRELQMREFGPVTFPAYAGASASLRSRTDDYLRPPFIPGLAYLFVEEEADEEMDALRDEDAGAIESHSSRVSRASASYLYGSNRKERPRWLLSA